ncbi:interferon a3-like [Pempheris klunzingeri]|uniref:interferon a3-like n=1 Tax=Pempheris klunzingeri TaxID=3127111 RepID=UPI0039811F19
MVSGAVLLVVLCGTMSPALCCDWLRHYGHLSNSSLTLLQLMGGQLTDQDSPVPFPNKLYEQIRNTGVESQLVFIKDSLELIAALYRHDNLSSVTWDTDRTEHFLMSLDRQTEELNACVPSNRRADSRLRRYFRRLDTSTLRRTGGSAASWELLRKETRAHLEQLDLLVASILHRPPAASRRRRGAQ